ncbi:response regulator transcription factor [Spirosoma daeguense]
MKSGATFTNILIADDHQLFNDGLRNLLAFDGSPYRVVDQVYTGNDVIPAIHKANPDIVLLDINLPNRNGLDIARQIIREFSGIRVVMVSMYSYKKFVEEAKEIGVSGYLLKSASQNELIACLRNVRNGKSYFDSKLTEKNDGVVQEDEFVKRFKLSPREIEIIGLMKRGLSSQDIARQLFLAEETVKTHRKNIYFKLDINNLADLIRFANEQGI